MLKKKYYLLNLFILYKFYKFYIKNSKFYDKFYTSSTSSTPTDAIRRTLRWGTFALSVHVIPFLKLQWPNGVIAVPSFGSRLGGSRPGGTSALLERAAASMPLSEAVKRHLLRGKQPLPAPFLSHSAAQAHAQAAAAAAARAALTDGVWAEVTALSEDAQRKHVLTSPHTRSPSPRSPLWDFTRTLPPFQVPASTHSRHPPYLCPGRTRPNPRIPGTITPGISIPGPLILDSPPTLRRFA